MSLDFGIAFVAQGTILIANESAVGQFFVALFTPKAIGMPIGCHSLDYASDDEFTTLVAARRKQNVKVTLTVFAALELVEDAILEGTEALGAHKALRVPQFTTRIDDFLVRLEALLATGARHVVERHIRWRLSKIHKLG